MPEPSRPLAALLLLASIVSSLPAQVHSRSELIQSQTASFEVSGNQPGDLVLIFYGLDGLGAR